MSVLQTYLALCAASQRRAVPRAMRRHVHLSPRPLVIVGYHLAGDVGAPLALMWGTDPTARPHTVVVPEPRNRKLRFDALETFGHAFTEYLSGYAAEHRERVCVDAPQIVVSNQATAEWLFGIVGRFTRHLRPDTDPAPPPIVPLAGKHLSFFHGLLPGSSLVLPATEILSTHWQTGQLPSEDLNLSALLGWIDPAEGADGPTAAREGEDLPPAGPLSDPNWDARELSSLINHWHEARTEQARSAVLREFDFEVRDQFVHTWEGCWRALSLVGTLPEADSVAHRWERDREAWTRHYCAVEEGTARFRNVPTPIQSAKTLRVLEQATTDVKAEMAFDDPLVMASHVASGEALSARVVSVDATRKISAGTRRRVLRPLVLLEPLLPFARPVGAVFFLASAPDVELEILSLSGDLVQVQVNKGAVSAKTLSRLPNAGDEVVLSPFRKSEYYRRPEYDETPWTHYLPEAGEEQSQ